MKRPDSLVQAMFDKFVLLMFSSAIVATLLLSMCLLCLVAKYCPGSCQVTYHHKHVIEIGFYRIS